MNARVARVVAAAVRDAGGSLDTPSGTHIDALGCDVVAEEIAASLPRPLGTDNSSGSSNASTCTTSTSTSSAPKKRSYFMFLSDNYKHIK